MVLIVKSDTNVVCDRGKTTIYMSFGVFVPRNIAIICLPNILDLSLPDEGYSRNALCALQLISTFLLLVLKIH